MAKTIDAAALLSLRHQSQSVIMARKSVDTLVCGEVFRSHEAFSWGNNHAKLPKYASSQIAKNVIIKIFGNT